MEIEGKGTEGGEVCLPHPEKGHLVTVTSIPATRLQPYFARQEK